MNIMARRDNLPLSSVLETVFRDPFFAGTIVPRVEEGSLAFDVSEDDTNVIVRASLPGFKKEDIDVEIHDGVLTINATHTEETEEKTERYYRKERRMGSTSRRIALPSPVQENGAKAELKDGVLSLWIPKVAKETPRKVQIN